MWLRDTLEVLFQQKFCLPHGRQSFFIWRGWWVSINIFLMGVIFCQYLFPRWVVVGYSTNWNPRQRTPSLACIVGLIHRYKNVNDNRIVAVLKMTWKQWTSALILVSYSNLFTKNRWGWLIKTVLSHEEIPGTVVLTKSRSVVTQGPRFPGGVVVIYLIAVHEGVGGVTFFAGAALTYFLLSCKNADWTTSTSKILIHFRSK